MEDNIKMMPLDYYLRLTISNDKVTAYLQILQCDENFKCSLEEIENYLAANGIKHGIRHDMLQHFVNNPSEFLAMKAEIAIGEPPMDGKNGEIEYLFDIESSKNKKPAEMADGTVDYKQVTHLNNIRKGELIARRILAEKGEHGRAVTGEILIAQDGKEAKFKLGKNVVTDQDEMGVYALMDGLITVTDKDKLNVFPVFEVNGDIDYSVGNIDFIGNVVVRGNVLDGFKIKAAGDIRITGGVEAAVLEAGGSIDISAGVLGHDKGHIKAGKNIKASFIHNGHVEAKEDVIVSQSIMHSHIKAGKNIFCQGPKGIIIGGTQQAGERVVARVIGNSMSTSTIIEVGVLPELRNELVELRVQLKNCLDNLDKTEKALVILDQLSAKGQLPPDKLAMRIKLSNTKKQGIEQQLLIQHRMKEIEETLDNIENARVDVLATVFGGTKITIGKFNRFVKDQMTRASFRILDGDIVSISNF